MTQRLQSRRDERIPEHWETLLRLKNVNIGLNCAMYSKSRYRFMEIVSFNKNAVIMLAFKRCTMI